MASRGPLFDMPILCSIKNKLNHHEFMLFDPDSYEDGFTIWGDDKDELAEETVSSFEFEPKIGQLSYNDIKECGRNSPYHLLKGIVTWQARRNLIV